MRSGYAGLYGWLTEEVMGRLSRSSLLNHRIIDNDRYEERFTLRVGFKWDTSECPLDLGEMGWWKLLELLLYNQVYDSVSEGVNNSC